MKITKTELREMIREIICEIEFDKKDEKRINDMVQKAKDDNHLLRLANQMANSIKDHDKAMRRGRAAEDQNFHDVAAIFFNRAQKLKRSKFA